MNDESEGMRQGDVHGLTSRVLVVAQAHGAESVAQGRPSEFQDGHCGEM